MDSSPYNKSTSAIPRGRLQPGDPFPWAGGKELVEGMALNPVNPAMPEGFEPGARSGADRPQAALAPDPGPGGHPGEDPIPAEIGIQVAPGGLKAFISILPPQIATAAPLKPEHILRMWTEAGLDPHNLGRELIASLAGEWNRTHAAIEGVLVAEAEHPPVPGQDARIELLVDPDLKLGPVDAVGTVDFKSLNLIKPVKQGQPLARKHPAGKGGAGIDLFGKPAPAPDGEDHPLPMGQGTGISPEDGNLLIASVSGFLRKQDGNLSVNQCFVVDGSVDYSTGNIDYDQSAVIRGDIGDGFTVNVGGALEVGGAVGEARVTAGGDILVKKGFVGAGHGLITSKGGVTLGFASNQIVRAHGDLSVEKECFNCQLYSRKAISVFGPLVGGLAMAGEEIVCRVAGNDLGTKTELEAGMDYILHENKALVEEKLKELTGHLSRIMQKLARFRETYRTRKRFTSQEARLMLELRDMQEKIQARIPELEKRKNDLLDRIRKGYLKDNIRVRVEKKVNPGVVIKVGSEVVRIQEEISGPKVFAYKLGRIKVI